MAGKLKMCAQLLQDIAAIASRALSHGTVTQPPARAVGPASLAAYGGAIANLLQADNQPDIEALYAASGHDPSFEPDLCNLVLCKRLQLEDNLANIQAYHPGQEANMKVWTRISHRGFIAQLEIVSTEFWMRLTSIRWASVAVMARYSDAAGAAYGWLGMY